MYASSDRSADVSQNSAISSAKRLTLAVARAASLGSSPALEHLEVSRPLHQLEEQLADVEGRGQRRQRAEQRGETGRRRPAPRAHRAAWRRCDREAWTARRRDRGRHGGRVSARASATTSVGSRRTRSSAITSLTSGRSWKPRPPMTTCGRRRAASASAIGRAIALVRHSTAISCSAMPVATRRSASAAIALASVSPSGHSHSSTLSPGRLDLSCLGKPRSGCCAMSVAAAATMRRELRWLRPSVIVSASGK